MIKLPIAPIWNWNSDYDKALLELPSLPIAPIWNWNDAPTGTCKSAGATNRTNLELKRISLKEFDTLTEATNRTNLELKPLNFYRRTARLGLPIAPIWNWNFQRIIVQRAVGSTNRTNLELKLCRIDINKIGSSTTNRTNLELKQRQNCGTWSRIRTTNRTNLELKPIHHSRHHPRNRYQSHQSGIETSVSAALFPKLMLPIAPIWNWNWSESRIWTNHRGYQSHQSGIETWHQDRGAANHRIYQSHQSGIETITGQENLDWSSIYQSHQSGIETCRINPAYLATIILPIAPIWNWNLGSRRQRNAKPALPIAPIWNWNQEGSTMTLY